MQNEIILWIKKLIATAVVIFIAYAIYLTKDTIVLLLTSGFLTLLITPLVEKWKKYKIPEWITVVFVYFLLIFLATVVMVSIIPIIVNYLVNIVEQVTLWSQTAQQTFTRYGIAGFNLPDFLEKLILYLFSEENINSTLDIIKQNAGSIQTFLTNQLSSITSGGLTIVSSIGSAFTNILMIGIATFFMVLERKEIGQIFLDITPDSAEEYIKYMFTKVQEVCISWIKASIILSFSIFLLTYIGLFLSEMIFGFRTDSVFTLALISGIMEFVPYIGPILSVIPALIIALGISFEAAVVIVILYLIIQQTENNFLVPYIMSKNLDLSPLFVFVIMIFGATLGGIIGIIVAVPIAGIIRALYNDFVDRKKKRGRYAPVAEVCEIEYEEIHVSDRLRNSQEILDKTKKYFVKAKNLFKK